MLSNPGGLMRLALFVCSLLCWRLVESHHFRFLSIDLHTHFLTPLAFIEHAASGALRAFRIWCPDSGIHCIQKDHVFENQCKLSLGHWEHSGFQNPESAEMTF